jgi:hypothetical protein
LNRLDHNDVRTAYRRQAALYDDVFGTITARARSHAVAAVIVPNTSS